MDIKALLFFGEADLGQYLDFLMALTIYPKRFLSNTVKLDGYSVTSDPIAEFSSKEEDDAIQVAHDFILKKTANATAILLKYVQKYPNAPTFYNFLYVHYEVNGNDEKALEWMLYTAKKFPNYLFAKINLASMYVKLGELEKVPNLIGLHFNLKIIAPEKTLFHITEARAMTDLAINYYCKIGEIEKAEDFYNEYKKRFPSEDVFEQWCYTIAWQRMTTVFLQLKEQSQKVKKVIEKPLVEYPQIKEKPQFQHPEIENLYQFDLKNITDSILLTILALPRTTLIEDLKKVIVDALQRHQWFVENTVEYDDNTQSFPLHALRLLAAIEGEEALPEVLQLIGQPRAFNDYWFGDDLYGEIATLYLIAKKQPAQLQKFLCEPNIGFANKGIISKVLAQIGHQNPSQNDEIVNTFKEIFQFFIKNEHNENLIDSSFLGSMLADIMHLRNASSALPLIEVLFEKELADPKIAGDYKEISKELNRPYDPHFTLPLPTTITEHYLGEYKNRRPKRKTSEEEDRKFENMKKHLDSDITKKTLELMTKLLDKGNLSTYDDDDNFLKEPKKEAQTISFKSVPQNSPCPCGSGRKYKNCHGKK